MNLEDCRPGTIVQTTLCGNLLTGVIERIDGVAAVLRQVELDDGKPCDKPWWFHASLLTLAPRFLVNGEWVADHSPWLCDGYVLHVGNEFPEKPWGWLAGDKIGHVATYAAAREAVEKAVGL